MMAKLDHPCAPCVSNVPKSHPGGAPQEQLRLPRLIAAASWAGQGLLSCSQRHGTHDGAFPDR